MVLLNEANWKRVKRRLQLGIKFLAPKVSDVEESGDQEIERVE